jgi:hypothetical protein
MTKYLLCIVPITLVAWTATDSDHASNSGLTPTTVFLLRSHWSRRMDA